MKRAIAAVMVLSILVSIIPMNMPIAKAFMSDQNTTHELIFEQARTILRNDGYENIADFLESKTPSGESFLDVMIRGSKENDAKIPWPPNLDEILKTGDRTSGNHYMQPASHLGLDLLLGLRLKSAGSLAQEKFDEAGDHWFHGEIEDAVYDLGWATHLVQDVCVPHHAFPTYMMGHSTFEKYVNDNKELYLISSGGTYSFESFPDYYSVTHYSAAKTAFDWVDYNSHKSAQFFGLANYDGFWDSDTPYVDKWFDSNDYDIETVHPLPNDLKTEWSISDHSASAIKVHFSEINMKPNDYLRILDGQDNVVESFTDFVGYDYDVYVTGNAAKIEITTDSSIPSYGYAVSSVSFYDTAHDPARAAEELMKQAQRTTAGFIRFFFNSQYVWRTALPTEAEIAFAKASSNTLFSPWDYATEPGENVLFLLKVRNLDTTQLHVRVVMRIWEILEGQSSTPIYDSSTAGQDKELWLDPGELSPSLEFQWVVPNQPAAPAYVVYVAVEDWTDSSTTYDHLGGWGSGFDSPNEGPLLHTPWDNGVALLDWIGRKAALSDSAALKFLFTSALKSAVGKVIEKIAGKLAGFGAGLFLSFLLSAQLAGWPPQIDAYAIDMLDGSLQKDIEVSVGDSVPIVVSLDTGDEQRSMEVVLEKKTGFFREEISSFDVPIYSKNSWLDGCYEIFLKQAFTFSEPGDYYVVTSYSSARSEVHVRVVVQSAWKYYSYDRARTELCSAPSKYLIPNEPFETLWSSPHEGKTLNALTADVNGDGKLEVVKVSGDNLKVISGTGTGIWTRTIPGDDSSYGTGYLGLDFLEDVTGDGVPEIFVQRKTASTVGNVYVYDGNGNRIKTLTRSVGYDGNMWAVAVFDTNGDGKKKVLCGIGSNYVGNPRGACLFDYNTGAELWYYAAGNSISDCIADLNNDGLMEITSGWWTVHNGAGGSGKGSNTYTSDSSVYVIVINERGEEVFTRQIHGTHTHGGASERIVDLNRDGTKELLVFHGHEGWYPGYSEIMMYSATGSQIKSYTGSYNSNWGSPAIADVNKDGKDEIIVGSNDGNLRIFDSNLNLIKSRSGYIYVDAINDLNGDGSLEVVASDPNTRKLGILRSDLTELWSLSFPTTPSAIVSDVNSDGVNDLLITADQLYVASAKVLIKPPTPIDSPTVSKISLRYSITPEGNWGTGSKVRVRVYDVSGRPSNALMYLGLRGEDVFIADFLAEALRNRDSNPQITTEEIVQNMYEGVTQAAFTKISSYIPKDYILYADLATVFHLFAKFGKELLDGTKPAMTEEFATLTFLLPLPLQPPTYIYDKYGYSLGGNWKSLGEGFGTGSLKSVTVYCLADLQVTDSLGRVVNKQVNQIPGAYYYEMDIDGDGDIDDAIILPDSSNVEYKIEVIPEPGASPDDTFSLMVGSSNYGFVLAKDLRMDEIPAEGFTLESMFSPQDEIPLLTLGCSIEPEPSSLSIETGQTAVVDIGITNTGNIFDTYDIAVSAPAGFSYQLSADHSALNAEEAATLELTLATSTFLGGDYEFEVTARSRTDPAIISTSHILVNVVDVTPPVTIMTVGDPTYTDGTTLYVSPDTWFALYGDDYMGSGIYLTTFRVFNSTYNSGWQTYQESFTLASLEDGSYTIEYYSIDNSANLEPTKNEVVALAHAHCEMTFDPLVIQRGPGQLTSYELTVKNTGFVPDNFYVRVFARFEGYLEEELVDTEVTLTPDQTTELTFDYLPPGDFGVVLGDYCICAYAYCDFDSTAKFYSEALLKVTYQPTRPAYPSGGLAVAVRPKSITYTEGIAHGEYGEGEQLLGIVYNVEIFAANNENYDDVINLTLITNAFPLQYQAKLAWMSWKSLRVFLPAHKNTTITLRITIPLEDLQSAPSEKAMFRVLARSETWTKGIAQDYGIIYYPYWFEG